MEKDALTSASGPDASPPAEAALPPESEAEKGAEAVEAADQAAPPLAPGEAQRASALTWAAVLLALAALGLLGWHWFDTQQRLAGLQGEVARRLAQSDAAGGETRLLAQQGQETMAGLESRLSGLEARLAESQSQQAALDALLQDMSRNRDDRLLSDVEQALGVAVQQLQLAGNVEAALVALQGADARLAEAGHARLVPLRKVLARDMERLRALPLTDVQGVGLRIESVASAVDSLPLAFEAKPAAADPAAAAPSPPASTAPAEPVRQLLGELWRELKSLIRIERLDRPDPALLTPANAFFLRENLRLRLLAARLALLQRDGAAFRRDVQQSLAWLERYFDMGATPVRTAAATLKPLGALSLEQALPDLGDSLAALRKLKAEKEANAAPPPARGKGAN